MRPERTRTHTALLASLMLLCPMPRPAQAEPIRVTVRAVSEIVIYPEQSAPATVRSLNDSRVSAEINARIEAIPPRVGDLVQPGDLLVQLDCRDNRFDLARAAARLDLAKQQLARARTLRTDANVSEELLNQRETEFTEAEVAHEQARLDVERCSVRAPFEGVVLERLASEGELAAVGTALMRLLETSRLEVSAQVSLSSMDSLSRASRIWFAHGSERYPVRLRTMTPAVNTKARSREVRYEFGDRSPLPGTAGRLHWQTEQAHLPADLILRRGGELGVLIAEGGQARFVALPDALEGHPVPIALDPETPVIIDGRFGLGDGDTIELAPSDG